MSNGWFVDAITERFQMLPAHPRIGRERSDLRPGLRCFPVEAFMIPYRIDEDDVLIVHVFDGRRNIAVRI